MSMAMLVAVGALVSGATGAWFSDTEKSSGNTFAAGAIDLKVDSECHYNGMVCEENGYWNGNEDLGECTCTWLAKDLGEGDLFFNFNDIKPGDQGENTISLHVNGNDAWGRMVVDNVISSDETCVEPELEAEPNCGNDNGGELGENLKFYAWLDQGSVPGFQGDLDATEGDNIWNCNDPSDPTKCDEPLLIEEGTLDGPETYEFKEALSSVYDTYCYPYGYDCEGLTADGHMVGDTTYYFGLAWKTDGATMGNEAQTDSLKADISFETVQYRNNPDGNF